MKNFILTSKKIVLLCFCLFTIFSCSEDLLEETTVRKSKEKPNLKLEFLSTKENPQLLEPFARKFPKKMKISTDSSGRQSRFGTLEGDFGTILLDQALEVNEGTYKTETYEVREKVDNPNLYYNVVVDKDEKIWLYKIERIAQTTHLYATNTQLVSKMELSEELTAQNPCSGATIVFPPFGIITPEYPSPSTPVGGGGATMPGVIHNPSIPIAGGSGFFNPVGGSNPSSGTIGTPVAGSSSGQGGIVNVLAAVGDAVQSAWNWIVNLFTPNPKPGSSDCGCKRRAVVLEPSPNPCPGDEGGYIAIVVQDEISDKIVKFQEYFMVLHNNDNVFLYENPQIVNDIEAAIAQNPANYNLFAALPELISATRLEKIDWGFVKKIISALNINPQSLYTPESYPGKEDGRPFEWWMDDIYIKTNLKMQTTDTAAPTETPNIYEILVFRLYPAQALKHVYNSVIAASMAANSGFQGKRNGKQDAFRHTFWNARDTADFGKVITEIFTTAHEINSGNHSLETEMDLFNNSQGRDIGESHSYITPNAVLATQITYDINTGTLKYLTPLTPEPSSDVIPGQTQIKWTNQ